MRQICFGVQSRFFIWIWFFRKCFSWEPLGSLGIQLYISRVLGLSGGVVSSRSLPIHLLLQSDKPPFAKMQWCGFCLKALCVKLTFGFPANVCPCHRVCSIAQRRALKNKSQLWPLKWANFGLRCVNKYPGPWTRPNSEMTELHIKTSLKPFKIGLQNLEVCRVVKRNW